MKSEYFDADYIYDNKHHARCIEIQVGLKVRVREQQLLELQQSEIINKQFKLNIKRLNRWWYSVYFDELKGE